MPKPARIGGLTLALALASAAAAHAQNDNRLALGLNFTTRIAEEAAAHGSLGVGPTVRLGHSDDGWGPTYGFNWFSTDIDQAIGGNTTQLGRLRVRPFMAGYGYTRLIGPAALSGNLLGGYALTSFHLTPSATDAYRDRLGARSLDARVGGTPVIKPEVDLWLDLGRKLGLNVNAGYMIARPRVTLTSTLGDETRRLRADMFILKTGLVYSLF